VLNSYSTARMQNKPIIYIPRSAGWSRMLELELCERKTLFPGWWLEAGAGAGVV